MFLILEQKLVSLYNHCVNFHLSRSCLLFTVIYPCPSIDGLYTVSIQQAKELPKHVSPDKVSVITFSVIILSVRDTEEKVT